MANKNSIESEIDRIKICHYCSGVGYCERKKDATEQIKNLIQREVKKGRVEELKKLQIKFQQHHERPNGFRHLIHEEASDDIDDRLEELEG